MNLYSISPRRASRANLTSDLTRRHRADFARTATIDAFGWYFARALDQAGFVDRLPGDMPGSSPGAGR